MSKNIQAFCQHKTSESMDFIGWKSMKSFIVFLKIHES